MGQTAVKLYKADSDAADVYRNTAGLDIASLDTTPVLGNFADIMKNNVVIATEFTFLEQTILPFSLPGDEEY